MSTLKVNTIQDTSGGSGSTPAQIEQGRAKAWVRFDLANDTVKDSYGVSSVDDTATGVFTVNFSTSFANTNYCAAGITNREGNAAGNYVAQVVGVANGGYATGSCKITTGWQDNATLYNNEETSVVFFGDQ